MAIVQSRSISAKSVRLRADVDPNVQKFTVSSDVRSAAVRGRKLPDADWSHCQRMRGMCRTRFDDLRELRPTRLAFMTTSSSAGFAMDSGKHTRELENKVVLKLEQEVATIALGQSPKVQKARADALTNKHNEEQLHTHGLRLPPKHSRRLGALQGRKNSLLTTKEATIRPRESERRA